MIMKDKLTYSKRVRWYDVLQYELVFNRSEVSIHNAFVNFCKGKRIKSLDKLAYCFLLHYAGRDFIAETRERWSKGFDYSKRIEDYIRIIKTKWIKLPEDD